MSKQPKKRKALFPKGPKRRNPNDATMRNIRALKARIAELDTRVAALEDAIVVAALSTDDTSVEQR